MRTRIAIMGVAIGAIVVLFSESPALAICDPGRTKVYEGSKYVAAICDPGFCSPRVSAPVGDFEATIPGYTPFVDFAHGGQVSAWPMLHDSGCSFGFAQGGNDEYWHAYSEVFWEVSSCSSDPGPREWGGGTGAHHVKIQWASASAPPYAYAIIVDNTTINSGAVSWRPDTTEAAVETHSKDDQNYGGYFGLQEIYNFTTCDQAGCYVPTQMVDAYHADPSVTELWLEQSWASANNNDFYMWDEACTS